MADTMNDIWNDNDGEEDEAPRKGGRLRRFGIFFLVLAAVLGVVLVAAYRDGTGFDALRRMFSYGSGEESTAEAQYDYDASDSNRFAVLGIPWWCSPTQSCRSWRGAERRSGPHPCG